MQQAMELSQVQPTVFLSMAASGLQQLARVHVTNPGMPVEATLLIDCAGKMTETSLGTVPAGESVHDVFIDEVTQPVLATLALKVAGAVVSQRVTQWQPPRHWVVHVVQTSHHDLGYTDLASNVLRVHDQWLSDAIDMAQASADYPDDAKFRVVVEQAWSLEHFLRHAMPARAGRMIELLRSGQFELNALYGNMTTELCSPEEMLRCLYPAFRLKREHGIPLISAEHNDIPGISWGVCQALADAGIQFFAPGLPLYYHWGNLGLESFWDQHAIFGHDGPGAFWWEAPSGKRVLFWCNNSGCGGDSHPNLPGLAETLQRLSENAYPYDVMRWPVNGGARDNSPYTLGFAQTIRAWNEQWAYPRLVCSTNAKFYADFKARAGVENLPVCRGELPGQDYPIGATSTAAATAVNRNNHTALIAAEKLAAAASLNSDYAYQAEQLAEAYEAVLIHDEHTWGHHFPAGPTAHAAQLEKAVHAYRGMALAHDILNKAMARVADHVLVKGEGFPLVVFNMTGVTRTDVVRHPLRELDNCGSTMAAVPPEQDARGVGYLRGYLLQDRWHLNLPLEVINGAFDLIDAATGEPVLYQLITIDADATVPFAAERAGMGAGTKRYGIFELPVGLARDLCFVATDVPAHGYKTYLLRPHEQPPRSKGKGVLRVSATEVENEFYRVKVDRKSGGISSLYDKQAQRELVDAGAAHPFNTLVVRDPSGTVWQPERVRVRKGANGPLYASVEITASAHGHPVIRQTVTLYAGIRRVELSARILKDATPLLDAHIAFPFSVTRPAFRYEGVLAALEPVKDHLPGSQWDRVTVQNWVKVADVDDSFNILWSALDAPVASLGELWPGYVSPAHRCVVTEDVKQHRRLTRDDLSRGWVYSDICYNNLGTNFSVSQNGELLFRYAITTRQGHVTDGAAAEAGWQAVMPFSQILALTSSQAVLPPVSQFVGVSGEQVVLLTLKRAEDGRGYIARLWNMGDQSTAATLQLQGLPIAQAWRTNAVEEDMAPLNVDGEYGVQVSIEARYVATVRVLPRS